MTTATADRTDRMLSTTIDALAGNLDKLAERMCEANTDTRVQTLDRLRRLSADLEALVLDIQRDAVS